jgi:hypothetical protein
MQSTNKAQEQNTTLDNINQKRKKINKKTKKKHQTRNCSKLSPQT